MKKLDQLTFTRFIAAFMVVLYHGGTGLFPFNFFPIVPLLTSGKTAVSYFFVLSGFVMALAYFRPNQRFDFRGYWTARFSRIYPVYLFSFVITCFYYLDVIAKIRTEKILASLFLYQAWIPTYALSFNIAAWSLSVEAFFYILFPFLAIWATRQPARRLIWISIGLWVLSQVVHAGLVNSLSADARNFLDYFPPFHLSSFLLGLAGGIWYLTESHRHTVAPSSTRMFLILALALVAAALTGRQYLPNLFSHFSLDVGLLAPFFLVIVLTLALDATRLASVLSHPRLVLLGDASYALYILHIPIRWFLERGIALTNGVITYAEMYYVYLPLVIVLSVFVFVYLERPARDWLRKNIRMLWLFLLDTLLIAGAAALSFYAMLGFGSNLKPYATALTFVLRVGLPIYIFALILFRLYRPRARAQLFTRLLVSVGLGSLAVAGLLYWAWTQTWVSMNGFPRLILLLNGALLLVFLFVPRILLRPRPIISSEKAV